MSSNLTVKILEPSGLAIEVSGLAIAAQYVGLPVGKIRPPFEVRDNSRWQGGILTHESVSRLNRLIAKGDEHAKIMRQVVVHMEITAPRYWWQQWATYRVGAEMYSGSTMYTLLRDGVKFSDFTPGTECSPALSSAIAARDLAAAKANLPEGFLQTRLVMVSYQTLRRVWLQRRKHRLGEWHEFIEAMQELPHCDDLIFVEPRNPWRDLWEQMPSPWYRDTGQNVEFCIGCGNNREYGHDSDCIFAEAKALLGQSEESAQ